MSAHFGLFKTFTHIPDPTSRSTSLSAKLEPDDSGFFLKSALASRTLDELHAEESLSLLERDENENEKKKKKSAGEQILQLLKLSLPYVGLTTLLLTYIVLGGLMFYYLENETELELKRQQNVKKNESHEAILAYIHDVRERKQRGEEVNYTDFNDTMFKLLWQFSNNSVPEIIAYPPIMFNKTQREHYWTVQTAIIYALTVISSTGYNEVSVNSDLGKILSVGYGLVGIPLMFITAANIGKLLSELIVLICQKLQGTFCPDSEYCVSKPRNLLIPQESLEVSFVLILGIILGFCGLGASFYWYYAGGRWTFLQAYHISFEGMISLALQDLREDGLDYIILLMSYKILSLAVLTMCLDLARVKILRVFTRIHFSGRKRRPVDDAGADLTRLLLDPRFRHILPEVIRKIYEENPNRTETLTSEDIFDYLRRLGDKQRLLREQMNSAFVPRGHQYMKYVDAENVTSYIRTSSSGWGSTSAPASTMDSIHESMDSDVVSMERF